MGPFRRKKSRTQQAGDLLANYLKLKAAGKAAKGAKKAAKGTAVYQVSQRTPIDKRLPILVGAGIAALVATRVVRGRGGQPAAA
jgi:hypothetical protein